MQSHNRYHNGCRLNIDTSADKNSKKWHKWMLNETLNKDKKRSFCMVLLFKRRHFKQFIGNSENLSNATLKKHISQAEWNKNDCSGTLRMCWWVTFDVKWSEITSEGGSDSRAPQTYPSPPRFSLQTADHLEIHLHSWENRPGSRSSPQRCCKLFLCRLAFIPCVCVSVHLHRVCARWAWGLKGKGPLSFDEQCWPWVFNNPLVWNKVTNTSE